MTAHEFSALFISALFSNGIIKLWLAYRQLDHVAANRAEVPAAFRGKVDLAAHQKAADYTRAQLRLGIVSLFFDTILLLAFTLGGGIQWLADWSSATFSAPMVQGVAVIASVLLLQSVLESPFDLYRTFNLEARFGFNKMTLKLYLVDTIKGLLLGAVIGLPLLLGVLWLMSAMGDLWWLYVWAVWVVFNLLLLFIYPMYIAPIFNKFEPLQDETQKTRIEALLHKCGFAASGLFVMDGSKRSTHGNAYFTGFGKTKRIVFFDTLLQRLTPAEVDAVLAHELGHFKKRHVLKRIAYTFVISLGFLWLLAQLLHAGWFYEGLGVHAQSTALALLLFVMALPVFTFLLHPIASAYSRKHEFEADEYAAQQTDAQELVNALVKLYQDNAKTLTPDTLYATFYESHPPAPIRIAHLQKLGAAK
jgi:STE24 endopeptidase